jgi:hypothetical protein
MWREQQSLVGFVEIDVDEKSETPHNLISLLLPNKTIWSGAKRRKCCCAERNKIFKN